VPPFVEVAPAPIRAIVERLEPIEWGNAGSRAGDRL